MGPENPESGVASEGDSKPRQVAEPAKAYQSPAMEAATSAERLPPPEYNEDQFQEDIERAHGALETLAEKARRALQAGETLKFPS